MRSFALLIASAALAVAQAASAQDVPARVGRLAYTQGPVSVYQDPEMGWDKAYVNTPITSENSIWTDRGARAEMRVGGNALRLDGETQVDISRLDEDDFDATIQRGSVNVRVRYKERNDHVTFATPHAIFALETDGRYRVDVDEDRDESRLTVFGGYAQMDSSQGRIPVEPGRTVIVRGSGEYLFERARENGFDKWATVRDQQWQDSTSRRYVSNDMTGYEELDRYGTWAQDSDYGAVWYPTRVASGWAPYRDGHWTYVRPWGWTWVDDAPWGYAPSHYGRWVQVRDRWGWVPGGVRERPVWAPALVGWIGGTALSIGVSSAPVGWYPLAPWERYDPWYRTQPAYLTRVNRVVVDRAPRSWQGRGDEWRHWNRDRAATVVNREVFVNRRAVQGSLLRMNTDAIRQATVVSGTQAMQQVLPQRNEVLRYRQANNVNVAAPTVQRQRASAEGLGGIVRQDARGQQQQPAQQQAQQQPGQVVLPEFRRRGAPPVLVAPAPASQPPVSAPAPQAVQPQQQLQPNPAGRIDRAAPQRQQEEAARAAEQQQQVQRREAERQQDKERADRALQAREQQERAVRESQGREGLAREQQQREAQQRAARDAQQQQERAAREAQQQQQREGQAQRQQQEAAQRAAQEQQQRAQQQQRQQQEAAQRGAQEQAQRAAQEQAQRAAQEQQQRAQQQQRQQQEAAQRAAQEQAQRAAQEQQRAQREARPPQPQQQPQAQPQPQQQPQAQPQPQQQQQGNPAARSERGNRERTKEEKDQDDKDKKDRR